MHGHSHHPASIPTPAARSTWIVGAGAALSLVVLLVHAWVYRFLTDDAFISFRYARNLSHGLGLVFNPGLERVEGYSNFLWVLVLAAFDRVGLGPEHVANFLSVSLTVVLWAVIARSLWRRSADPTRDWTLLVPLAALAACRSFAMWSTSGLETRAFELLVVAGMLRLVHEIEPRQAKRPAPLAAVLLGLAALTRPDGVLVAACALGAAAALEEASPRSRLSALWARGWPCAALIAAHLAFRLAYYHELLPNTYYAKIGGRLLWGSGFRYVAAFVLEYSLWLWLPIVVTAVVHAARRRTHALPVLVLAVLVPHTLYVVAIGGDHFEYRPLDLWFPLLALVLPDGLRAWCAASGRAMATGAYACALIVGMFWIPNASHREFPTHYMPAFPGIWAHDEEALAFLDPGRDPVLRMPPFELVARAHRDLTRWLTRRFVAVRQEEHRMFLASATAEANALRGLIERGVLPRDVSFAMSSVGVIPYVTGATTLDRLGLTDSVVAHSPFTSPLMAHGKHATLDYARRRGVDLWFYDPVYAEESLLSRRMVTAAVESKRLRDDVWAAEVARDTFLLCKLPQGSAASARRMPRLTFHSLRDSSFSHEYFARAIAEQRGMVSRAPSDLEATSKLALLCLTDGRYAEAAPLYREILGLVPGDPETLEQFASCQLGLGDREGAAKTMARELSIVLRYGRTPESEAIERNLRALQAELAAGTPASD